MGMSTFILVLVLSTSSYGKSGAASVTAEFSSRSSCQQAGDALTKQAHERGNYVLAWGCFQK